MKKITIFLMVLFIASVLWYGLEDIEIRPGITDVLIYQFGEFSEAASDARNHLDSLRDLKDKLLGLYLNVGSIPDEFREAGTIKGIFFTLRYLVELLTAVLIVPFHLGKTLVLFIIDAIKMVFELLDFMNIFHK